MQNSNFKPSLNIDSFFGETVDNERFLLFVRAYYEWLQTSKITISDKVGTFSRGETITGSTSKSTAVIKEVGSDYLVIKSESYLPFEIDETITGGTSGATASISVIKDNVVRATGQFLNNRYLESSVDKYVDYLRTELYDSIPKDYLGDKRQLALKFKNFFESKSNEESYRFIFKLLYNEPVEFYYPGEDVLRVSDGNFEKTRIIRAVVTDEIFDFLEKTIRGETSGALANVVDVKKFFIGGTEIAELTLKLVSGNFSDGETIVDIDDETLTTTLYGIITGFTINDAGSGYQVDDEIIITGNGSEAAAKISSVKKSPISALKINTIGHGYQLNANATINNSGTGGSGLIVRVTELANTYTVTNINTSASYTVGEISRVSIINRGENYYAAPTITLQDTTIASLGLLSPKLITINNAGSNYGVGNTLIFTGGSGANAAGQIASINESFGYSNNLLFEDGFLMLSENSYDDVIKTEDWNTLGSIKRIELTNFGNGYTTANLPSISVSSTTGSNANLVTTNIQGKNANVEVDIANNVTGLGSIRAIEVTNFGINYSTATAFANTGDGNANITPIISGLGIKDGNWIDDDGKVSYKYIQDSYYYQDFSYVLKSGLAFSGYSDIIKKIIHPAGLQFFGEILIKSNILNVSEFLSEVQKYVITFISSGVGGIIDVQMMIDQFDHEYDIIITPTVLVADAFGDPDRSIVVSKFTLGLSEVQHNNTRIKFELPITIPSEILSIPTNYIISLQLNAGSSYGEFAYGDLIIGGTETPLGPLSESYVDIPISDLASFKFSDALLIDTEIFNTSSIVLEIDNITSLNILTIMSNELKIILKEMGGIIDVQSSIDKEKTQISEIIETLISETSVSAIVFSYYDAFKTFTTLSSVESTSNIEVQIKLPTITIPSEILSIPTNYIISLQLNAGSSYGEFIYDNLVIGGTETPLGPLSNNYADTPISDLASFKFSDALSIDTEIFNTSSIVLEINNMSSFDFLIEKEVKNEIISEFETLASINSEQSVLLTTLYPISSYGTKEYQETPISTYAFNTISEYASNTIGDQYSLDASTESVYNNYQAIQGNVSYALTGVIQSETINLLSQTTLEAVAGLTFFDTLPQILGIGTIFNSDFGVNDVFVANDEYFSVTSVVSNTLLYVDRNPSSTFTNVIAYKQI